MRLPPFLLALATVLALFAHLVGSSGTGNANGRGLAGLPCTSLNSCVADITGVVDNGPNAALVATAPGVATKTAVADASGAYTFPKLPPGTYTIGPSEAEAASFNYLPSSVSVVLSGNGVTTTVSKMVRSGTSIAGKITEGAGATVVLLGIDGTLETVADADGRYSFKRLSPGEYAVLPQQDGFNFVPGAVRVIVENAPVTAETVLKTKPVLLSDVLTDPDSVTQSTSVFDPLLDSSTTFSAIEQPTEFASQAPNYGNQPQITGEVIIPGGPAAGGLYPENRIPAANLGTYEFNNQTQTTEEYNSLLPINVGDENPDYPFNSEQIDAAANCRPRLRGYSDLYIPRSGLRTAFRLSVGCTANLLDGSGDKFAKFSLRNTDAPIGTRFFSTAAHCFGSPARLEQIAGGRYTSRAMTMCAQLNATSPCRDTNSWAVARFTSGSRAGNAAVYVTSNALSKILEHNRTRAIDDLGNRLPRIPDEVDYAIFAAYPLPSSGATEHRAALCQVGRQYQPYDVANCCSDYGRPPAGQCPCVQRSRSWVQCIFGCPCKAFDCRSTCKKVKTLSHYFVGYPGSGKSPGCQGKNGLIQYRSDLAEAAASIQACVSASTTKVLVAKGYSCPGNSGAGMSIVGGTTIYGTVVGSPRECSSRPSTITFSVLRKASFYVDTYIVPYYGSIPYQGTNYDVGMNSLCTDAGGCVARPCP